MTHYTFKISLDISTIELLRNIIRKFVGKVAWIETTHAVVTEMPQWLYRAPGIIHCRTRRFRQWVQYHIHIIFFLIVCLNIQIFKTENSYKLCHCKLIITLSNGLIGKTNLELNFTAILNGHLHVYLIHPPSSNLYMYIVPFQRTENFISTMWHFF